MEAFDPDKTVEEYDFNLIPMWVRVFGLPLGSMNRATGELIGKDFHELLDVDVGHDGKAVGKFLRIKVKLNIQEPLMRGFMLDREKEKGNDDTVMEDPTQKKKKKKVLWCRFEYEYLPDFCYTCGIVGHCEKECMQKPVRGEAPQFGPWLRAEDTNRRSDEGGKGRWGDGKGSNGSRSWSGGRGGSTSSDFGDRRNYKHGRGGGSAGSDAPSWRKDHASNTVTKQLDFNSGSNGSLSSKKEAGKSLLMDRSLEELGLLLRRRYKQTEMLVETIRT